MAGGAELAEFVAVGAGLLLGALGAGGQVLAFAGRFGAHLAEQLVRVGADPRGFVLGGAGCGLGAGGLLLRIHDAGPSEGQPAAGGACSQPAARRGGNGTHDLSADGPRGERRSQDPLLDAWVRELIEAAPR